MEIIDMTDEYEGTYCHCLEEWSPEMKESGGLKSKWYKKNRKLGLRVKLAKNNQNKIVGMIQYVPIEYAPVSGKDLYYIYCIWVHGNDEGVGNNQNKGIGTKLLEDAEADVENIGGKGIVAWGIMLPFFMQSKWFKKKGYQKVDQKGLMELVWKRFDQTAEKPVFIKRVKKPEKVEGKVTVTVFQNGWCPAQNVAHERVKHICEKYREKIDCVVIDTSNRDTFLEWGILDALYINGKEIAITPAPSYEKIEKTLIRAIKKLPQAKPQ
jgi:N-acetylglutamate synthase-like GNAT family acetyltransferase